MSGRAARRSFDALFKQDRPPGPLAQRELARIGYPEAPAEDFPLEDWRKVLEAARVDWFPELSEEAGFRSLGEFFVQGFARGVVGSVMATAARMLGTERTLARVPSYLKASRTGSGPTMTSLGLRHWGLHWDDTESIPGFIAGAIGEIVRLSGSEPKIKIEPHASGPFDLDIRWVVKPR